MAASASSVLADSVGPGGTAAIVVFVLILASVGIFVAFIGSQKRLRQNVSRGMFNTQDKQVKEDAPAATPPAKDAVSPDPEDRPGAGA